MFPIKKIREWSVFEVTSWEVFEHIIEIVVAKTFLLGLTNDAQRLTVYPRFVSRVVSRNFFVLDLETVRTNDGIVEIRRTFFR